MQRRAADRRGGDEGAAEADLDALYTTPPSAFVARRAEFALAAKREGRAEDARRIQAARRPTLAAWAANLLLRSRPEEAARLLELGEALRDAQRALDAAGLKELSAQRRRVTAALSAQAAQLALDAGHRLSSQARYDVESTLRAVLADPDAAARWATGRLETALVPPSDFLPGAAPKTTAARGAAPAAPPGTPPKPAKARQDELAERRRRQRERLARARRESEAAERRLRDDRDERADAETVLGHARERAERLRQEVSDAERQLADLERQVRRARDEFEQADRERRQAEERHTAAADAVSRAERDARAAAREVERLQ